MQTTSLAPTKDGITWRQPVVFVVATVICTILAIWAVVQAPTNSPVSGVSGLYIAAAIYVPLALWFGIWGCLAGYLSCIFMGLWIGGYSWDFLLVWSLADFFEGFVPLLIYRSLKLKPALTLKRPKITYGLNVLLAANLVVSAWALINSVTTIFVATFALGISLLLVQAAVEDHKTWLVWLIVGVLLASVISGVFGVGALTVFGSVPPAIFSTVFFGWVFGDIIVLATLGTILTVVLTPYVVKAHVYVRKYFT